MAKTRLKKGFTTGASAAASVKAGLIALLTCQSPRKVEIRFLTGETRVIPVHDITTFSSTFCQASVIKDAGDDPDITHKAEIGVTITLKSGVSGVTITGGKGVGMITKPGLEVEVGEPAINSGPRQMIEQAVHQTYQQLCLPFCHHVHVEIFVPEGEELAKKTLNARLGILGGISILGTTGIVTPMSHDAYIATIKSSINVAAANKINTLVFTTGRRSERFAMARFTTFKEEAFIQTGDFFKASLDMALLQPQIKRIIYTVFFGKAVKMALGFEHTHAAKSELTMKKLSEWAKKITGNEQLSQDINQANTARHAFSFINPSYPDLIYHVGGRIKKNAQNFSNYKLDIRVIIFDFDGNIVFDSE
ncbi:MAG: cobalt-precorrin-5B (C(1))-methyltransferase CbiD [Desulfobacula sp.]|nr:cobalt-precorrin-5B (C(1))-methyltransferase CbiD [Desulfobacula sp.]